MMIRHTIFRLYSRIGFLFLAYFCIVDTSFAGAMQNGSLSLTCSNMHLESRASAKILQFSKDRGESPGNGNERTSHPLSESETTKPRLQVGDQVLKVMIPPSEPSSDEHGTHWDPAGLWNVIGVQPNTEHFDSPQLVIRQSKEGKPCNIDSSWLAIPLEEYGGIKSGSKVIFMDAAGDIHHGEVIALGTRLDNKYPASKVFLIERPNGLLSWRHESSVWTNVSTRTPDLEFRVADSVIFLDGAFTISNIPEVARVTAIGRNFTGHLVYGIETVGIDKFSRVVGTHTLYSVVPDLEIQLNQNTTQISFGSRVYVRNIDPGGNQVGEWHEIIRIAVPSQKSDAQEDSREPLAQLKNGRWIKISQIVASQPQMVESRILSINFKIERPQHEGKP